MIWALTLAQLEPSSLIHFLDITQHHPLKWAHARFPVDTDLGSEPLTERFSKSYSTYGQFVWEFSFSNMANRLTWSIVSPQQARMIEIQKHK